MTGRTLVAGVGNIFLHDDAFGVEVIRLLAGRPQWAGVEIADFGIRGVHLVYELLNGCDVFVLVDAAQQGYEPGTVTVLEVEPEDAAPGVPVMDAHSLTPDSVFAMLSSMGGHLGRCLVVACEPADLSPGMGLSDQVQAALPHAVHAVEEILGRTRKGRYADAEQADAEQADAEQADAEQADAEQADQGDAHRDGVRRGDPFTA